MYNHATATRPIIAPMQQKEVHVHFLSFFPPSKSLSAFLLAFSESVSAFLLAFSESVSASLSAC